MLTVCKTIPAVLVGGLAGTAATVAVSAAIAPPPKAYVVAEIHVNDAERYKSYAAAALPIVTRYGGRYIARGGRAIAVEGAPPAGRIVLIEFPTLATAQAFEASPDYLAIAPQRQRASTGRVFLVEGVASPQ